MSNIKRLGGPIVEKWLVFSAALTAQGMKGELLNRQSSISAMHEGCLVDLIVALSVFGAMCLVPKDARRTKANPARFAAIFKQ